MESRGVNRGQEFPTISHVQAVLSSPNGRFDSENLVRTSHGVPNIVCFIAEGQFAQPTAAMPLEVSLSGVVTEQASEFLRNINRDGNHIPRVTQPEGTLARQPALPDEIRQLRRVSLQNLVK